MPQLCHPGPPEKAVALRPDFGLMPQVLLWSYYIYYTMLQTLTSPPTYTSAEEHAHLTSSTPSSFADIPPVLHFTSSSAEVVLSPLVGGWESWPSGSDSRVKGTLWVTEASVLFCCV